MRCNGRGVTDVLLRYGRRHAASRDLTLREAAAAMMDLALLGGVTLRIEGQPVLNLEGQKQKAALLAFLAVEGAVPRDELMDILWAERDVEGAGDALSHALNGLRQDIGEDPVVTTGAQLALAPGIAVDVKRLEAAAHAGRHDEVVELYRGPFLGRFHLPEARSFAEWQSRTRAWLGGLARAAYRQVVADRDAAGDSKGALEAALAWAEHEPLEDDAQHALIALMASAGNRARALRHFDAYRSRLEQELGVEPLEETTALVEAIRRGPVSPSPLLRDPAAAPASAVRAGSPPDLERQLAKALGPELELVRKTGEGPSAAMYLAREPALERLVTVKVLLPSLAANPRARRRFEREMLAVASLTHANIVALLWSGRLASDLPFFVLQHVEGMSLSRKLALEGRLTVDETRKILGQLAAALDAAHRRGIVHRGLQPATVLVEENTGRVLLSDFGTALILEADPGATALTISGETIGDPAWLSPEQLSGGPVTPRSDVFTFGLLAYTLLTEKRPPAKGRDPQLGREPGETPRPLRSVRPDLPPEFVRLIERCTATHPSERPSAAELRNALAPDASPRLDAVAAGLAHGPLGRWLHPRVPYWVVAYIAGGFGILELIELAVDRGMIAEMVLDGALVTYLVAAPVLAALAWHRGRRAD